MNQPFKSLKPIVIGVAGPSGAGKSTVCKRIIQEYPGILRLKFDDFFCDEADVDRHPLGFANWDNPSSIKWELLQMALMNLKAGLSVTIPDYQRRQNKMVGTKCVQPAPIILLDGYQVLHDPGVREQLDFALYFDLEEDLQIDRRIARQPSVDRGYLYHVMIPAARAFLYPTKKYATHIVNASQEPEAVYVSARSHLLEIFAKIQSRENQTPIVSNSLTHTS